MATIKGVNQTLIDTGGESTIAGGLIKAQPRVIKDSYVIAGTEGVGTILKLFGALPAGAIIQSITMDVTAGQTAATVSVGDTASATRYQSAGTGLQTVGRTVVPGLQYAIGTNTSDNQIILTTAGATLTAATLYAELAYTDPVD